MIRCESLKMECSICFDEITKETGQTILSCQHSFHFNCIGKWFVQKILDDLDQECPCCRNPGVEEDRLSLIDDVEEDEEDEEEDEEEEDDESEISEESEEAEEFNELEWETRIIIIRRRKDLPEENAARNIQRIYRGYKGRELFQNAMALTVLKQ